MLGEAVLRAEEDEGGRHNVQQEREDDPEGGQEDRTHGTRAPENSWFISLGEHLQIVGLLV